MPVERLARSNSPRPKTGIVHLGLGAFFRAFGCEYVADAMAAAGGDWGIIGVSLRSPTTRDVLKPQGWAYTSVTLAPDRVNNRVIEVLNNVLVAPENPEAVLRAMAGPSVKIVSLTVTEKGYCHTPATGELNTDHPDILHDLTHPLPRSAIGFLVRALQRRKAAGHLPFTVLSCDNLPENGGLVRGVVLAFAREIDPALADWITEHGRFPSTMVDRITPATTEADIAQMAKLTGRHDAAPVIHEPYKQWAVEDSFVDGVRPDFAAARAEMISDVRKHEAMKLRMLNGTHSALAYTGYLAGHETIADTVADPVFAEYLHRLWSEIIPTVDAPDGVNLNDYADTLFNRYANPAVRHLTWQIAMDGSQKIPLRLLQTLRDNFEAKRPSPALVFAVAAWMRYVSGVDEQGESIDVRDPLAERLRSVIAELNEPTEVISALLKLDEIFPLDLVEPLKVPLIATADSIWSLGVKAAVINLRPLTKSESAADHRLRDPVSKPILGRKLR